MKIKKVLAILLIGFTLAGCGEGATYAETNVQEKNMPNLVTTSTSPGYAYIIDKNTGVVYLRFVSGHQRAMTVMLNADGTPVTAKQLGIEY